MLPFIALMAALGLSAPAGADQPDYRLGHAALEVDSHLRAAAPEFGGAVIIEVDGRPIIARGYGYADREEEQRFTTDTIAQIGSITKTFTALAIAQLASDGRIDLDGTVARYIPEAPEPAASRTIEQLLTHTSGLLDVCGDDFDPLTKAEFLQDCMSRPLENEPGERNYSNANYALLAAVVEAASGGSWQDYLRERIWRPLGMTSTGYSFQDSPPSGMAFGYKNGVTHQPITTELARLGGRDWNLRGNGGMQASARDMIRFLRALTSGHEGLDERARRLMTSPHLPAVNRVRPGYGLLFRYLEDGRPHRVIYTGSDGIFYSYIAWYPDSNTLLYFVSNSGEQDAIRLFRRGVQGPLERALGFAD